MDRRLPGSFVAAVESGEWQSLRDSARLFEVFHERVAANRTFYGASLIEIENATWRGETDPAYLGCFPHDLDPSRSLLIGDLGDDRPFALDFRTDPPVVRLLNFAGEWVVVADSVEDLIERLSRAST